MAVLEVERMLAGYRGITVVRGIDLHVEAGEVVALLGANGAGKSTTLLTISGLAEQQGGDIRLDGTSVGTMHAAARARAGLGHVTEDRSLFTRLTTMENLRLGGRGDLGRLDEVLHLLPALEPLLDRQSGSLSGGEQQMLALSRALASDPALLMLDELSMGLAPLIVDELYHKVRRVTEAGVSVLVVEQFARTVLGVADVAAIMSHGRITKVGTPAEIESELSDAYLGGTPS